MEPLTAGGPRDFFKYDPETAGDYLHVIDEHEKPLPPGFVEKLMRTDLVSAVPNTPAKEVAAMLARYDLLAVPVLDDDGEMLGIVTVDDAIGMIIPEHIARSLPRRVLRSTGDTFEAN